MTKFSYAFISISMLILTNICVSKTIIDLPNTNNNQRFIASPPLNRVDPCAIITVKIPNNKSIRFTNHQTYCVGFKTLTNTSPQRIRIDYSQLSLLDCCFKNGISISQEISEKDSTLRYLININKEPYDGAPANNFRENAEYRVPEQELYMAQEKKLFNLGASLTCSVGQFNDIIGLYKVIDIKAPIH